VLRTSQATSLTVATVPRRDYYERRCEDPGNPVRSVERDHLRSDNGLESIAQAVKQWLAASGVRTLYIEPGSPWENAYSGTFISWFGDELLKRGVFSGLLEAKILVAEYRNYYNHQRPHSALVSGHRRRLGCRVRWIVGVANLTDYLTD
jgi:transposase InsO family protein